MNATQALQQATLYTDATPYVMASLHPRAVIAGAAILSELAAPFSAVIVDKHEVSLVIPSEVAEAVQNRLPDVTISDPYRLITFDLPLPPDLVGFMALVATLLAQADIAIIPLGAFHRDHILVPAAHFDRAWQILSEAQQAP